MSVISERASAFKSSDDEEYSDNVIYLEAVRTFASIFPKLSEQEQSALLFRGRIAGYPSALVAFNRPLRPRSGGAAASKLDDDGCSDDDDLDEHESVPPDGMFARHAAIYRDLGYSPIYVKSEEGTWPKDWPKYCHEAATPEEIEKWGGYVPSHNIALATGYRGLVAIDVDTSDAAIHAAILKALPHCRVARFGSKGFALLCQYHRFEPTKFKNIYAPKDKDGNRQVLVEIKGDGQNITVPPSIHRHTGSAYVWINPETGEALDDQTCPPLDDLPLLTDADIERLRKELEPGQTPRTGLPKLAGAAWKSGIAPLLPTPAQNCLA